MRNLYVSAVASRRLARARRFVASAPPSAPWRLIAPSPLAATRLIASCLGPRDAQVGVERTPLHALALRLATPALARRGEVPCSRVAAEALVTRALDQLASAGELGRLDAVRDQPGLPRALAATLDELQLAGVTAERLVLHAPELSRLLLAFEHELARAQLASRARVLELAARAARAQRGVPTLWLDVPIAHRREQELAVALLSTAPSALATVALGDERSARALASVLTPEPESDTDSATLFDGALVRVQSHLFEPLAPSGTLEGQVTIFSAPGEGRECVEVVRALLDAARAGMRFDRMAVWMRRASSYRSQLEEALARAGIPAYFAEGSERPDPSGRALLALLRCAREGLSAAAFAEYLSLDALPAPPGEEGRPQSPRRMERLLHEAAVIAGRERFERRLRGKQRELQQRRAQRVVEGQATESIDRALDDAERLLALALPLLEQLERLPGSASFGEWLQHLDALAQRALRAPSRVREVLASLAPLAELGPVRLPQVLRVLSPALRELREPPGADASGRVFCAETQHARGLDFDLVCVLGLAEKAFPEPVREDPLLLDTVREQLCAELQRDDALALSLATNASRAIEERVQLRLAIGSARERIILSYPRMDVERGRPRVPSFYGLEVVRAAEGALPGYESLMRRADDASSARLGWPAPRDPARAIDAAEHDLASLQPILSSRAERGAARYLLTVNPHLARALRFRARRWMMGKWTEADGLVDPGESVRATLAQLRLTTRAYSPTALQLFAQCPYRFYLSAVVRLATRPASSPIAELDPAARGSLLHEVQAEVLGALRDEPSWPLDEAGAQRARERLERAVREVAERHREQLAPAVPRIFDDAVRAARIDLERWLHRVLCEPAWRPHAAELEFDVALASGVRVKGRIDAVERSERRVRATDYKTGKVELRAGGRLGGGEVLQPLIYALALEQALPDAEVWGGRLEHCTSAGGFAERAVPLDESARADALELLATIDDAVAAGFLPAAPAPAACERCEFQPLCGPYEAQRTARKDAERLQPLTRVRGMP